jgi:hypothetical protein
MQRITDKQLDNLATWLNELTGSPTEYRNKETGKINVGHFTISHAYGGVCLHRICNEGGGCSTPLSGGHIPKRDLFNEMHAFIKGLEFAKYEAMRKAA